MSEVKERALKNEWGEAADLYYYPPPPDFSAEKRKILVLLVVWVLSSSDTAAQKVAYIVAWRKSAHVLSGGESEDQSCRNKMNSTTDCVKMVFRLSTNSNAPGQNAGSHPQWEICIGIFWLITKIQNPDLGPAQKLVKNFGAKIFKYFLYES